MIKRSYRALYVLAAAVAAAAALAVASPAAYANVQISFPVLAMEGNLQVSPGATLQVGYGFTMSGKHPAAAVSFPSAQVTFNAGCVSGSGGGVITVPLGEGPYTDPKDDGSDWFPSGDQSSSASYEGSVSVPDLCGGGQLSLQRGGTFTATLESSDATDPVQVRWHYSANGSAGGWSGTMSFTPGPGGPPPPPPPSSPPQPTQIIVKVDRAAGYTIGDITAAFPVAVDPGGLASRGIYLVSPTTPAQDPLSQLKNLANQINGYNGVVYAEVNLPVQLADTEFHGWPYGSPVPDGNLPAVYTGQPAATTLQLAAAHAQNQGAGVTVAVLDTGAEPVPALSRQLLPGWNYVADTGDTGDLATAAGSAAVGHGTFVSGLVALVAPQARILPEKVLDSEGYGTSYGVSQAILDATAAGAKVINLSFGTGAQPPSKLLQQAIQQAQQAGVVVVAAAGNEGNALQEFPAGWPQVLSVAALDQTDGALTSFSDFGGWVDVGAPGVGIVGPMPDGSYAIWAGTSMATPFVSGQAALILSLVPGMHADHVFQAIENTATLLPTNPIRSGAINIVSSLAFAIAHP
jgi:subtilisin family serine protease